MKKLVTDSLEFKLDGTEMSDITEVVATGTGDAVFVETVKIKQNFDLKFDNDNAAYIIHEVKVNLLFKVK